MIGIVLNPVSGGGKGGILYKKHTGWEGFPMIYLGFHVAPNYSKNGKAGTFKVDPKKISAAGGASEHARSIVEQARDLTDLEKLETYRDAVCGLTDYNYEAVRDLNRSTQYQNNDPWQVVYVFDGDPGTKTICAGYARAFQLLCDMTQFQDPGIRCNTVTGRKDGQWHMWNVVHMDDGENYLTDLTCCDTGPTATAEAFLKGSGDEEETYQYDKKTQFLFEDSELELSKSDYDEGQFEGNVRLIRTEPEVKLAKTEFIWTGKQIHPKFTVKAGDAGYLTPAEYIVSFGGDAASAGLHRMTVTLKGRFRGSREEEYVIRPAGTDISGVDLNDGGFVVQWDEQRLETTGYQLQYGTDQSFEESTKTEDIILKNSEISFISEEYNTSNLDNGNEEIIKNGKMIITLTTIETQKYNYDNNINNMTAIDIGGCENLLREENDIPADENLYMRKIDIY